MIALEAVTPIRISERVGQDESCDEVVLVRADGGEFGTIYDFYKEQPGVGFVPDTRFAEAVVAAVNDDDANRALQDAMRRLVFHSTPADRDPDALQHGEGWRQAWLDAASALARLTLPDGTTGAQLVLDTAHPTEDA